MLFYHLCLARPDSEVLQERARRFAGFYLNEDPEAINYDPQHKIVLSGLNGSKGAVVSDGDEPRSYSPVGATMEIYGLPFFDLPGISSVHDLSDPANAKRMGEAMHARWRAGDAPANLAITSMLTNAFLLTGEEKYRAWVVEYTDAWMERSRAHDGLLPDQIGPSGAVGEYVGGKWYAWWALRLDLPTRLSHAAFCHRRCGCQRLLANARRPLPGPAAPSDGSDFGAG